MMNLGFKMMNSGFKMMNSGSPSGLWLRLRCRWRHSQWSLQLFSWASGRHFSWRLVSISSSIARYSLHSLRCFEWESATLTINRFDANKMMIYDDLWWFYDDLWWLMMVYDGLWWFMMVFYWKWRFDANKNDDGFDYQQLEDSHNVRFSNKTDDCVLKMPIWG